MPRLRRNDDFGGPATYEYPGVGSISPSTLRYVKVLTDLKAYFASLDGLDVCEIGVGYGGQCRIINAWFKPASYCLVDIAPALALARRFLERFDLPPVLAYRAMDELTARDYDLVISNYAFTELPRPLQDGYLEKVILRSARGYITYNEITPAEFNSYKAEELLRIIPGAHSVDERPLTHPLNCIILWGDLRRAEVPQ
jgi:putative sugar O-methyltransferase